MRRIYLLLTLSFFLLSGYSQSISGNVFDEDATFEMEFATVDIYKNGELVASLITDPSGNFNISLDTGTYECEIQYAGYKKTSKTIKVTTDEKASFKMKSDPSKPAYVADKEMVTESTDAISYSGHRSVKEITKTAERAKHAKKTKRIRSSSPRREVDEVLMEYKKASPSSATKEVKARAGALTAGELNDFSKWALWQDISNEDLKQYADVWGLKANQRYSFQLLNEGQFPVVGAEVQIRDKENNILWMAKSDNTGKAELWPDMSVIKTAVAKVHSAFVKYKGQELKIKKPISFDKGVNSVEIVTDCGASKNVDICFVVDATSSMSDEIQFLKKEMNHVIYKSKEMSSDLNFRFSNVFYRDVHDSYLTKSQDFTRVLTESSAFIQNQGSGGGGDYPEAVEVALDTAINKLGWSDEARTKILFLILDAPPHNSQRAAEDMRRLYQQAAAKGIRIVPVVASGINKSAEYLFRNGALATNGTYVFLSNHSGIGGSHITPTTDKVTIETLDQILTRIVKNYTFVPDCQTFTEEVDSTISSKVTVKEEDEINPNTTVEDPKDPNLVNLKTNVYPNPTNGPITIESSTALSTVFITDMNGKIVRRLFADKGQQKLKTDLTGLAQGIYLVRYPHGDKIKTKKIIYQR